MTQVKLSTSAEIPYDMAVIYGICTGSVTDELLEIYSEICTTFHNVSYNGHVMELDYIESLLNAQNITTSDAADSVLEVLLTAVEDCLHVVGLSINPDIPIRLVPSLISTLLEFDTTDTPEPVMAIVEDSEGPVECICDLLGYYTQTESDVWLEHITGVEVKCITAIKYQLKLAIDRITSNDLGLGDHGKILRDRASALKSVMDDVTLADISTESSTLEDLYNLHVGSIVDMDSTAAVREIMGLAVMSNESSTSIDQSIDLVLDDLFYEPSERIKVNGLVRDLKRNLNDLLYK